MVEPSQLEFCAPKIGSRGGTRAPGPRRAGPQRWSRRRERGPWGPRPPGRRERRRRAAAAGAGGKARSEVSRAAGGAPGPGGPAAPRGPPPAAGRRDSGRTRPLGATTGSPSALCRGGSGTPVSRVPLAAGSPCVAERNGLGLGAPGLGSGSSAARKRTMGKNCSSFRQKTRKDRRAKGRHRGTR